VGAVVVRDGAIVGEGWHEGPGTPHAEVAALRAAGPLASGATVVSSLEPCNRYGRTPPCTRALIEAGVARVVIGAFDPHLGEGRPGVAELRGARLEVLTEVLAGEAERQNAAFLTHVRTGLPFVVLKMAASLDGRAAAADGSSRWITGEDARADVQRLRAWSDAIVVGVGTALADDPALTVRDPRYADASAPLRVVVDSTGRLPASGRLFDGSAPTLVASTERAPDPARAAWTEAGAEVVICERDAAGGVSLPDLTASLGKRDVQGVLLEGGPTLAWSAVRDGIVDRVVWYVAPLLVGGAGAALGGPGFAPVTEALRLDLESVDRVGEDVRVEADVHRDR
jgi:diaminohydroxyphosphoribosylaminopyrimidine deaminase/5-amino-6-(5-phosphoribosylamino)uracil reductase